MANILRYMIISNLSSQKHTILSMGFSMTEDNLKHILSHNIKQYRTYQKISQSELAEKTGISIPFLSDIENGKKWLSPKTFTKMAAALKVEAYELLRPETDIPDTNINVLKKYTDDIHTIIKRELENIQKNYINKLNSKKSNN
jgi:transcriptional regulator with XRE-family HTH domain